MEDYITQSPAKIAQESRSNGYALDCASVVVGILGHGTPNVHKKVGCGRPSGAGYPQFR
jgi:hypothetical protein